MKTSNLLVLSSFFWALFLFVQPVDAALDLFTLPQNDPKVITQQGKHLHFYKDLVKNKVAIIQFIYTHCQGVCIRQGKSFAALSKSLGDRLNRDVVLISISIEPNNDTPKRLTEWVSHYDADPRWMLLTGNETEIRQLVRSLAGDLTTDSHDATAVLIYLPKRRVLTEYCLASPTTFLRQIDAITSP